MSGPLTSGPLTSGVGTFRRYARYGGQPNDYGHRRHQQFALRHRRCDGQRVASDAVYPQRPSSATAGSAVVFTVTAQDTYGNTATGYAGTVHFTSSDGAATLPANAHLTNGTATFSVVFATKGSRTVTATDTVSGSVTGTTSRQRDLAGDALRRHGPVQRHGRRAFNIQVTADDVNGNTASGYWARSISPAATARPRSPLTSR